jgi:hypothetical protein
VSVGSVSCKLWTGQDCEEFDSRNSSDTSLAKDFRQVYSSGCSPSIIRNQHPHSKILSNGTRFFHQSWPR